MKSRNTLQQLANQMMERLHWKGGGNMRKDFLVVYSQDNSIKEELKTREELQTLLSDEDIEIISVNDKFPTYLYHLTTEENLEKILKDGKLIPKYNNLYFASNIESCVHLANPATYTKYKACLLYTSPSPRDRG